MKIKLLMFQCSLDVFCYHLPLAFLNQIALPCLQICGENSHFIVELFFFSDIVGRTTWNYSFSSVFLGYVIH